MGLLRPTDPLIDEAIRRVRARVKPIDLRPNDMVGWTLEHFRIPREEQADMRLRIAPYQVKALQYAFSRDERGLFNYDIVLWGDIKKGIKSTLAAAAILWRAWHVDYGQFYVVANTREQADSRVFYYLRRAIELNPNLASVCKVSPSQHYIELPNHARIEAIAVNAAGEAGGNPTMVEVTEAWGATTKDAMRLWTETTLPPALFGKSQRWLDTYAGYKDESELLWQLYDTGVLQGEKFDPEYDFFYRNKVARMFSIWNTRPRLSWQTPEYYSSQRAILAPQEYSRVHENQWASASEAFVPKEWWDACASTVPAYADEPCVMAIDGAMKDDSFAIVLMDKDENKTRVRYARCWYPPLNGQIDFVGTSDEPGPELEIVRLCREYNVIEVAFDQTHILDMLTRLSAAHSIHIHEFSQGQLRLVADKALRDNIRDRNIMHSNERDLSEHIANADAKIPPEGREFIRIVKRSQKLKCDLAVCLSMANHELRFAYNL